MTAETGTFTPTDEDVERAAEQLCRARVGQPLATRHPETADEYRREATRTLSTIGPILERERRAAKAEALREAAKWWGGRSGFVRFLEVRADEEASR